MKKEKPENVSGFRAKVRQAGRKIGALLLASAMTVSLLPVGNLGGGVQAADELDFNPNNTYAAVSVDSGKAINFKAVGWQTHTTVDGTYVEDGDKVTNTVLLQITPAEDQSDLESDEVKVKMEYVGLSLSNKYPVRAEGNNTYIFADADKRQDQCIYIIKKTGENQGTIRDINNGWYFGIADNNDEIVRVSEPDKAVKFKFVENPTEADFSYYIEHTATNKYVRANGIGSALSVDGEEENGEIGDNLRWTAVWGDYNGRSVTFNSKETPNSRWQGGNTSVVTQIDGAGHGGWESIRVVPNGDGTISFKDTADGKFFTVDESTKQIVKTDSTEGSDDNGKFIIHSVLPPEKVTDVNVTNIDDTAVTVSWTGVADKDTFYTGYKVVATPPTGSGKDTVTSAETIDTTLRLEGLEAGTKYEFKVLTVNADDPAADSDVVNEQTKNGPRPVQATELKASKTKKGIKIEWKAVESAESYDVYRAPSAFGKYEKIGNTDKTDFTDENPVTTPDNYSNYYRIIAVNENGDSDISDEYTSLETEMFGKNVIIFADTDDREKINEVVQEIFKKQNDFNNDAQFNSGHYAIYYKKGDYKNTECVPVGFYTHVAGLGSTPYNVELNNIEVPAYLDGNPANLGSGYNFWDEDGAGGIWRNATCNFWRSAENLSVTGEGDATVLDKVVSVNTPGFSNWAASDFNWSVAQAAPLRRVYSTRNVRYDWSYGWASGGYTADCYFTGNAKTDSGQQYFTRNSIINGDATGTQLNNFNMGVVSDSLPNASNGGVLLAQGNGYSNWSVADANGKQQVITNVTETPTVKEKPFLFMDDSDGEYKIFVPALRSNSSGISWSETSMGEGKPMSLDNFYIAHEGDTAKTINEQLEAGKNIFFTPGVYYAEEVIKVNNPDTIVLGTGMATIVPTNGTGAMEVADVDGVTISGLIFDAGTHSEYLLKVGEDDSNDAHSDNPTLLQDLFFRVGGTTSELTKADDALIINSNDTIGDHFWIWRADHGAGVAWDGNESQHGLIVNGDNVKCYALFNEHFQEYNVLWNGDNGATYFFQNETCYDPQEQDGWMSHNYTTDGGESVTGAVNGYASYKVANNVKNHYAVGLGAYCVFIYTGGQPGQLGDSMDVSIQLDNAIEVPNSDGVLVENACIQTFAKAEGALQKINHIINGVGEGVSSGNDKVTGETGEGWSRKYLILYKNGEATVGNPSLDGAFTGVTTVNAQQPGDDFIDATDFYNLYTTCLEEKEELYTPETWKVFVEELENAKLLATKLDNKNNEMAYATQAEFDAEYAELFKAYEQLEPIKKPETVDKTALKAAIDANSNKKEDDYTADSWKPFEEALKNAQKVYDNPDATQQEVKDVTDALLKAAADLKLKSDNNGNGNNGNGNNGNGNNGNGNNGNSNNGSGSKGNGSGNGTSGGKTVKTGDDLQGGIYVAALCMIAAAAASVGVIRKRRKNGR